MPATVFSPEDYTPQPNAFTVFRALDQIKRGKVNKSSLDVLHLALRDGQENLLIKALNGKSDAVRGTQVIALEMEKREEIEGMPGRFTVTLPTKAEILERIHQRSPELAALLPTSRSGLKDWWKRCGLDHYPQTKGESARTPDFIDLLISTSPEE